MRVCVLTAEYPPLRGGVGDYSAQLARALGRLGVEATVITSQAVAERAALAGPLSEGVRPVVRRWDWGSWPAARRAVDEARADLLHIQYQTAAYGMHPAVNALPLWLKRQRRGIRVLVTFHDFRPPYLFPKAGPLRHLPAMLLVLSSDAAVITTSEDWFTPPLAALRQVGVGLAHKLTLIPIGSNIPVAPPAGFDRGSWRRRLGLGPSEALLCYFGFLNRSKGAEILLAALAQLLAQGRHARLLMVGAEAGDSDPTNLPYERRVRRLAEELGLGAGVLWTGFAAAEEVSAHLLAADLCVLPFLDGATFRRGSLMAALAHGLPIITTTPPPVTPLAGPKGWQALPRLAHGENVWLVSPGDAAVLSRAIGHLLDAPELRARLAAGARGLASSFGWETIAQAHLALYQRLGAM